MPLLPSKAERDVETFKVTTAGAVLQGGMPAEVRDVAKGGRPHEELAADQAVNSRALAVAHRSWRLPWL